MYPGGANNILMNKLQRICDSFNASRYNFPESEKEFNAKIKDID